MSLSGRTLAGRFVLGPLLGAGGMGQVYRATDERTGRSVAVKIMLDDEPDAPAAARFAAEIEALSALAHPGIVGYVAHGLTDDRLPFLAMEHLDGEELTARLDRGPLGLADTLVIARHVAAALDCAHRRGVVHRDLKPSNLFLRGGACDGVCILDFGIARKAGGRPLTRTGTILGTPEYMAPEQARGEREIGPAADVFALGCVLYHCLTGQPPFAADHVMATLGKILFDEPTPLAAVRPDVPAAIGALLARMLDKRPETRLHDAGEVLAALDALDVSAIASTDGSLPLSAGFGLGRRELELITVLVVAMPRAGGSDVTLDATAVTAADATLDQGPDAVMRELSARGVTSHRLLDGAIVATVASGSAVDQAAEAVSAARAALTRWPDALAAVATARGVADARLPAGEALDRAASMLAAGSGDASGARVMLDEVTAGLLDGRFRVVSTSPGLLTVHEEPTRLDTTRLLLGKPTPCVGREQELGMLELQIASAFDEGAARAMLVVAPPGLGKSRLRHELLRRLERRDANGDEAVLRLEARGELLRAGSPHALLAQALRRFFGVEALDAADGGASGRSKVQRGVERHVAAADATAVAELLGELCDVPFPDDDSVRLRAARQDPRVMQAQMDNAFLTLLGQLSQRHRVLIVLEDLHWADRASLELLGVALRELHERPLFIAAFARPEIHDVAPGLWKGRVTELPLRPLGRRACERLVERVVEGRLAPPVIARIVAQSDGNALFLEELVRAACDGNTDGPPETVLAMLQSRVGRLDTATRRVLRAASVFGEGFEADGLNALLGPAVDGEAVRRWLDDLAKEEIVEPTRESAGSYRFRHALMRDAAYGLLTDEDRLLGHSLAATWLAQHGDDPAVIGEHYVLAHRPNDAAPWFVKAAQRAHDHDDFTACATLARRGRAAGVEGEMLGALSALEAFAQIMRWDWAAAEGAVTEAVLLLPPGSHFWCHVQRVVGQLAAYRNDPMALRGCADALLSTAPLDEALVAYCDTLIHVASSTIQVGFPELGRALLARFDGTIGATLDRYPALKAWRHVVRCTLHRHTDDDLAAQLTLLQLAMRLYEEAGASRTMIVISSNVLGEVECRAGCLDDGEARLRRAYNEALELGSGMLVAHSRLALGNGLLERGTDAALDEAASLAHELLAVPGLSIGYQAMGRDLLAYVSLARGDAAAAEREARAAIALSPHTPVRRWQMVARLGRALVRQGRAPEAQAVVAGALAELDEGGVGGGFAEAALVRVACTCAESSGDAAGARSLADRVARLLARRADAFRDVADRERFVAHATRPEPTSRHG